MPDYVNTEDQRFVVPGADSTNNTTQRDVIGNKTDTVAGDSLVALSKQIVLAVGGEATQLRTNQSDSSAVEEDGIISFGISLMDIDTGAIAAGSIDITGIVVNLEKSTGGGAFSNVGITQPTFAKAAGLVSVDYRFLAAEWEIGDIYKLSVSGIEATIGADTAYVKTMVWSNVILEEANVEAKIDAIQTDLGDPSARTNSQTIEAMLGNPDAAGKTIYGNIGDFVGQTNLQTLLAALGIPDVAGKPLYTVLVTDRLDNGTYGLSVIQTELAAVQTDLGNPSARTNFQDIENMIGIPDAVNSNLDDMLRTGYDSTAIAANADGSVMERLENIQATNGSADSSGTFSYLDAGGEQTVVEITTSTRIIIEGIWLDLTTITLNGTIKLYYKVDGTNYREFSSSAFTVATDSDGVYFDLNMGITEDFKVTYTESADEGAARAIPYSIIYRDIE
jgi:hypothetical protein